MEIQFQEKNGELLITPLGEAVIRNMGKLHQAWKGLGLDRYRQVRVELSGIEEMDSSGLQMLLALKLEGWKQSIPILYEGHPACVLRFLDLYGLAGLFGDPLKIPGGEKGHYRFRYGTRKRNVQEILEERGSE